MEADKGVGKSDVGVSHSASPAVYVPQGKEELIAELNVYLNWPEAATTAIIFGSDVHGWENPLLRSNWPQIGVLLLRHTEYLIFYKQIIWIERRITKKKIADKAAAAGYAGLVPDFFHGDPFVPRSGVGDERYFPWVKEWIQRHTAAGSVEESRNLMEELKRRGITSFGFSGFCWGARLAMLLDVVEDFKAIVLLHPSLLEVEIFNGVRAPIAILAAEFDTNTPVELVEKYKARLNSKPESFVKVYKGTHHGWTVAKPADEAAQKAADESHQDMLEWYKRHLN